MIHDSTNTNIVILQLGISSAYFHMYLELFKRDWGQMYSYVLLQVAVKRFWLSGTVHVGNKYRWEGKKGVRKCITNGYLLLSERSSDWATTAVERCMWRVNKVNLILSLYEGSSKSSYAVSIKFKLLEIQKWKFDIS